MRRVLNAIGVGLLVLAVIGGAFAGYLATSNTPPRKLSEGWLRVKSMPSARGELAAAIVERKPNGPKLCPSDPCPDRLVYALGGMHGSLGRPTDLVQIFDPPANAWRKGPPLPEARHHLAAAAIGDTLYVTGGTRHATRFTPERNFWVLRPGHTSFERLASMPEARAAHTMVSLAGKLYVLGGVGQTSRVLIFDPASGWSVGSPMPSQRDHSAAVVFHDRIYVIGGRTGTVMKRVDIYDPAKDAWSGGPALPVADSGMAAGVLSDGLIHVVGGESPKAIGGGVRDIHLVLDPVAGEWLDGPRPLLAVHGVPGVVVQGKLLIVGGARRQGPFSILGWTGMAQVFDPSLLALTGVIPTPGRSSPPPTGGALPS